MNAPAAAQDDLRYSYRPSVLGAPWTFRLTPDAMLWDSGRSSGRIPFASVTRVRMSFRPATMQNYRFVTNIWGAAGAKLVIVSTSWRSMMEQERLDAAYAAFITELHRRIAKAGALAQFEAGIAPARYWPGLIVYVGAGFGLAYLIARTAQAGAWNGAAVIAVFLALFLWNGNYFLRNRPGRYRPTALPPDLMPKA